MNHLPPKWADRLLEWYCRRDRLEDLQGDLYEYYHRNASKYGNATARFLFVMDVLRFFRIYTIKKLKTPTFMNGLNLLENYWKTSIRSISRNKLFSAINVVGLAISMSVGILMILFVTELLSFDTFHAKKDRIFRVISSFEGVYNQGNPSLLASTSPFIAKKLKDYSGLEEVALIRRNFDGDTKYGDKVIGLSGHWADNSFFNIFSFEILAGNPDAMLNEPNQVVLTKTAAGKLFGVEDPIGKILTIHGNDPMVFDQQGGTDFIVSGLMVDPPTNSHIQFEMLGSYITPELARTKEAEEDYLDPTNMWMYHAYLLLNEDTDPKHIQTYLDEVSAEYNANTDRTIIGFEMEPMSQFVPGKDLSNKIGPSVDNTVVYILFALTLIILLSACFNYTNLSIARSLRRVKEVGIRKVVGARRNQLLLQFVMEAVILSFGALILGIGLFHIIKPEFLSMAVGRIVTLSMMPVHFLYFVLFSVLVGIVAGLMPALFLSKIAVLSALKDTSRLRLFSGINLRRVLIVFQFTLSIAFIIATTLSYKQYRYALNFNLGFTTDNILNIPLKANDPEVMTSALLTVPGVEGVSKSAFVLSSGNIYGANLKYQDPLDSISTHLNYVDQNFLAIHDFDLLAGTTFTMKGNGEYEEIIVNEMVLRRFQIGSPEDAIGQTMELEGKNVIIAGVVPDFQHATVEGEKHEFIFRNRPGEFDYLNLKVNTTDVVGLMADLEGKWRSIDSIHLFEAEFFEDKLEKAYSELKYFIQIIGFLAVLAISISSLGLLGMAVYTAESRIKEISIRKVLGATEQNLMLMLSKGFVGMILIAGAIAMPISYYIFDHLILSDMANRISIDLLDLSIGVILTLLIALVTVGWQTNRAARTNPAATLRDE